jgi:hypothetical protein
MILLELHRQRHHVVQDAVDAEADAELLLVGLDVDVGGPPLERVHEEHVGELDHGGGVGRLAERPEVDLVFLLLDRLDVGLGVAHGVEVDLRETPDPGHVVHGQGGTFHGRLEAVPTDGREASRGRVLAQLERARRPVVVVDRLLEGRLRGHDRLDVVAGHELDVVHGEDVRRIGHGDGERRPGPREGQHLVLAGRLRGDDLDDRRIDLEVVEVDRGHAVLAGEEAGDLLVLHEAEGDKRLAELAPVHLLMVEGVLKLLRSDHVLLQQQLTKSDGHSLSVEKS